MLGKRKRVVPYGGGEKKTKANTAMKKYYASHPRTGLLKSKFSSNKALTQRVILKYCDYEVNVDPTLGSCAVKVFTANGLYDPDISGVGHQPNGFDQYMQLFTEYCVLGATIKVIAQNTDGTYAQTVGIALCDFATVNSDIRVYIENGNCTFTTIGTRDHGDDIRTLTYQADIQKFSSENPTYQDNFKGTVSTNPTDTHYFHIFAGTGTVNSNAVQCLVTISYDVIFSTPSLTSLS